jgi:DNA-directed RNA polymerase specialized sigma24 family protein
LRIDELLEELAKADARKAKVLELRLFAGLRMAEISEVLGLSIATVERDSRAALAWMSVAARGQ